MSSIEVTAAMDFAEFIAPFPAALFMDEYYDAQPLHIAAVDGIGDRRRTLLDWAKLSALLGMASHWTAANLQLVMNSRPVNPEHFMAGEDGIVASAQRADPAMIETMLAVGASLVADGIEQISPEIGAVAAMLGSAFAGRPGANAYCSFAGIQAFASHCDPHEVFAIQCEGEKSWKIYTHRADRPVGGTPKDGDQGRIDQVKGPVLTEVLMRPGDLLYLPRGFYHDAVAQSDQSLHLTFSVAPLYGAGILHLAETLAREDSDLRAWLPRDQAALDDYLARLADKVAALIRSPAMKEDIRVRQRTLARPVHRLALPDLPELHFFARTQKPAAIVQPVEGSYLKIDNTRFALGLLSDAARWALAQQAFSIEQFHARFRHHPREELDSLIDAMRNAELIAPYDIRRG